MKWHTEQFLLEIEENSTGTLVAHFVRSLQLLVHTVTTSVAVKEVLFSSHAAYPTFGTVELPLTYVIIKQTTLQTSVTTKFCFTFLTCCGHLQTGIIIQTWNTTHSPALWHLRIIASKQGWVVRKRHTLVATTITACWITQLGYFSFNGAMLTIMYNIISICASVNTSGWGQQHSNLGLDLRK